MKVRRPVAPRYVLRCVPFLWRKQLSIYTTLTELAEKTITISHVATFLAGHTHAVFIQRVSGCLNYGYMYLFTFCLQSPTKEPDICEYLRICNNCHQTKKQKQVQDIVDGQVDQVGLSV